MKQVMIVGAGRLGKGFFGETFDNAGWKIAFLDKDPRVVEELKRTGSYHVEVHRVDSIENRTVSGYEAYVCDENYSCMDAFLNTDVIMLPRSVHYLLLLRCRLILRESPSYFYILS